MTNTQLWIAILIPTVVPTMTVLIGIFLNYVSVKSLRTEMNARFDAVDAELRYFHGKIGAHDEAIDTLKKKVL